MKEVSNTYLCMFALTVLMQVVSKHRHPRRLDVEILLVNERPGEIPKAVHQYRRSRHLHEVLRGPGHPCGRPLSLYSAPPARRLAGALAARVF